MKKFLLSLLLCLALVTPAFSQTIGPGAGIIGGQTWTVPSGRQLLLPDGLETVPSLARAAAPTVGFHYAGNSLLLENQ